MMRSALWIWLACFGMVLLFVFTSDPSHGLPFAAAGLVIAAMCALHTERRYDDD